MDPDLKKAALMFNWVEYTVFCSMLFFSLLIGVYYGWFKKQDTVAEYMLGGKKMGVFPVTMSLVFSHVSGITLLGVPAEIYSYGTQFCAIIFCVSAIYYLVSRIYLPVFYHLQLNSLYEYLELRFSKGTRTLASFIFAISLIIYIPVVVYLPALAFNQVTGVSIYIICPIVSLICIFYTSFGGLRAVVWTDALQGVFTLGSIILIVILGYLKIGSISEVFRINDEGERLEFFNLDPSPFVRNTLWTVSVGSIFIWIPQLAVHPGAMQRFIAVSTYKQAKSVIFWACVGFVIINTLVVNVGLLLYATFHDCDPVASGVVQKTGQILPVYVVDIAKDFPGLTGLFISGVLSAALSTMSAGLNTVAGTLYEDFVMFILRGEKPSERRQNFITKVVVLVLGLVCAGLVVVVEKLGTIFQMALSLAGVTNGALTGIFTLGILFSRANAKGAVAGALTSLVLMGLLVIKAQRYMAMGRLEYPGKATRVDGCPPDLIANLGYNASANVETHVGLGTPVVTDGSVTLIFRLSYLYYCALGSLIVFAVGIPVSYLTEPVPPEKLDPMLFTPCVRRFLPKKNKVASNPPADEYTLVDTGIQDVNNK